MLVGDYQGIGQVHTQHRSDDSLTFDQLRTQSKLSAAQFAETMKAWLKNEASASYVTFGADIAKSVSRETVETLEKNGICCVRYNKTMPLGSYALDAFASPYFTTPAAVDPNDVFVFHNIFYGKFALASKQPHPMSLDELEHAAFLDVDSTAQVIAFCRRTGNKSWEWGPSRVYPDGCHVQPALSNVEQYAQSCFEGMLASVNAKGEIVVFRPERNAARFAYSCERLAIPPLSVEQFVDSVKLAVLANKKYLPRAGSQTKMYVRPYVKGLDGGYGITPADSYVFAVEVFPFSALLGQRGDLANLVGVKGKRRSHEGGFGAVKASGNYGQTILDRVLAKEGLLTGDGHVYQDIFYFGERKKEMVVEGKKVIVSENVVDEDSSGNLMFLKSEGSETTLFTAPLDRRAVLPGVTRDSLLTLARQAGVNVVEKELTFDDIRKMDIGFISGTALGMVRLGSLTYDGVAEFSKVREDDPSAPTGVKAFTRLYDLLSAARRGEYDGNDKEIRQWAMVVGKKED